MMGLFLFLGARAFAELPCECPKLGCDPCSIEHGIKFYAEKCGPADTKVRSCARPTCVPVEEATAACPIPPVAGSGPRKPIVVQDTPTETAAAEPTPDNSAVGRVKVIQGAVSIVHADGAKSVVTKDSDVHESDTLEAGANSGAIVAFNGGNQVHVHADTALEVKEYKDSQVEASRRTLLRLIKGKIRNQVEQKYNGKTSYYRIETKAAVAGVRGTDFVIEQKESSSLETTVEALKGKVVLTSLDERTKREISKGEGAKFFAKLPPAGAKEEEVMEAIRHGSFGAVYKISGEKLKELDRTSRVDLVAKRKAPAKESAICENPKGFFNQCAWRCVGNPDGEKKCRIDLKTVKCVRQRCNGNGEWAEDTPLPEQAARILCPASGDLVKPCDY